MTSDSINGLWELAGAVMLLRNCYLLWMHKSVRGVSVGTTCFFSFWGIWNLFFYPANGLWCSFFGGILLASVNVVWVVMAVFYSRNSIEALNGHDRAAKVSLFTMRPQETCLTRYW